MTSIITDIQGADGVRLREQFWAASAPRAEVVLHHGLWDYSDYYAPFAAALAQHGYAVTAFDMRGHGRSDGPRYQVGDFKEYLADLDIVLKRVAGRAEGRPIFIVGHSLGGLVSTLYGIDHPKGIVRGYVISGAGLKEGHDVTPLLKAIVPVLGALLPGLPSYKPDFDYGSRDTAVMRRKRQDPLIDQKGLPARAGAAGLRAIARAQADMEKFAAPVLILHGTEDRWTNSEGSRQLAVRAAAQDKTLKLYEGFYHELLTDIEKERVWKDIMDWIDARS